MTLGYVHRNGSAHNAINNGGAGALIEYTENTSSNIDACPDLFINYHRCRVSTEGCSM